MFRCFSTLKYEEKTRHVRLSACQQKQEFVRPRWPYDMRPSARAEKYMCVILIRWVARRDAW